MINQLTGQIM